MLQKKYRLDAKYFKNIYQKGKKFRGDLGMFVVVSSDSTENPQFGFVVSKKIGNAVQRHRMTRLLREVTHDVIKKFQLEEKKYLCQYIAFRFTDSYEDLYKEYSKQILEAFNVNEKD